MTVRGAVPLVLGLVAMWGAAPVHGQSIFDTVRSNDLDRAKAMLVQDPTLVRARDQVGNTPLHAAAIGGSVPIVEWLLSKGADIDAANTETMTPLGEAIRNSRDDVARALIERGAGTRGALFVAARRNRVAVMDLLLAKGVDLEERNTQGNTPLSFLTRGAGPFEALEWLVRKGANFNLKDSLGSTPLDNALLYATEDNRSIDLLLARSAEVNTTPERLRRTLPAAARRGHQPLFEYYLARGGEAMLADPSMRQAVMRSAILGGSLAVVKALQSRSIALDHSANAAGMTPLHALAARTGTAAMVEFLVRNGADINARTNDGRSAYNIAEAAGNREIVALLRGVGASPDPQQFPRLTGPYLGQKPPGDQPVLFAPGIIALDHGTVTVSPDGQELYWPTGTAIMTMRIRDGRWTQPAYASFSGPRDIDFYDDVPFITPDGKRLFFTSLRPLGSETSRKENIWYVERTATGWSEPKPVGPAVNGKRLHWQVSVSSVGTLYFGGEGDVHSSRLVNGEYTAPVALAPAVNSADGESQPFIAPDESYILFQRAPGQVPTPYVSFKGRDGQWLPAVKIDLPWRGGGLIVTPDGKYLFVGGYWMSTRFLEDLRRQVLGGDAQVRRDNRRPE